MRYMAEFERAMEQIGIRPRSIRQSHAYRSGTYIEQIKIAMERRFEIFEILAEHQTLERHTKPIEKRKAEYYPFRVYCERCGKDETRVTRYDETTLTITYSCLGCNYDGSFSLHEKVEGKLVWKGVPKLLRGLQLDAPPDEELKQAQRSFFVAIYSLLCNNDTGPRLPTLFLSIGKDRVRALLTPQN